MLQFDYPWALAITLLPVFMYWLAPEFRDRSEAVRAPFFERLVSITGAQPTTAAVVLTKNWLQKLVWVTIWLLIVAALARPQWVGDPVVRETSARDMMLIVDLSGSMDARDFDGAAGEKISRLEAVKEVVGDFIERRRGDRLALAIFGNAAFLQTSFTDDHDTVRTLLDELQVRMAGPQTMIGDSIGLAIKVFEASESDNKVAILLTDGNDTGSQMPVARAATIAAENGITIHAIAIGDPATVGESALDIPVLEDIAKISDGRFFLGLNRDELVGIYDELDRIEPELVETLSYRPTRSLFHYPLGVAIGLAILFSGLFILFGRRPVMHA